jgi:hypothetical protein
MKFSSSTILELGHVRGRLSKSGDHHEHYRKKAKEGGKENSGRRGGNTRRASGQGHKYTKVWLCQIWQRSSFNKIAPGAKSRRGIIVGASVFRATWKAARVSRAGLVTG